MRFPSAVYDLIRELADWSPQVLYVHFVSTNAVYALATLHLAPCANQPFDGLCVNPSGSGLQTGSVVTETISKNGSPVREDYPIVQGDGTIDPSPIAHFELPCVAGNEYSADATGTSADSLTFPKAPGIPISSNTVERTSVCP